MQEFVSHPQSSQEVLDTLKQIILKQRKDSKEDIQSLFLALRNYNRYGDESPFLTRLSTEEIMALTVGDLLAEISGMLNYKRDYFYVGSLPVEVVQSKIASLIDAKAELRDPLPYQVEDIREPSETEILFFDWETAQAQVRIEFADGKYDESNELEIELYNDYFGGGMSSIVFQELREARALAYSVGARYLSASNRKSENLMLAAIGTQPDKAVEALEVFLELFDNLPESEGRFENTLGSLENQFRVGKLKFRQIPGAVKSWEQLGFSSDPRPERFAELKNASFEDMTDFHKERIAGRPKLISIVGPRDRLDLKSIAKLGTLKEVTVDDLFRD